MKLAAPISVEQIDALLPQTQCGKCRYAGCRPYAEAIAHGEAINRCPPGGQQTVAALAALLERPVVPLSQPAESPLLAVIDEAICIGCTKCISACPVDAILGAPKQMHIVLQQECTGCELCVTPCPVDCIRMTPHPGWEAAQNASAQQAWLARRAAQGRLRHQRHKARLAQLNAETLQRQRTRRRQRLDAPKLTEADSAPPTVTIAAQRQRLKIRLARMRRDSPERAALEAQLVSLEEVTSPNVTGSAAQQTRAWRLAQAAAEERVHRAERHLAHCLRQEGPEGVAAAREQLARAQQQLLRAKHKHTPPAHGDKPSR